MTTITDTLLGPLLSSGAPKPLITFYDDATGARVELSRATTANWAAKTANWLVDELDLEPGTRVAVRLPPHWQTAGVLLGAWWCGAHVVHETADAEVAFVPADQQEIGTGARTIAAVGLDALGAPVRELNPDTVDYISEIRSHGDEFMPIIPVDGSCPALLSSTVDDVVRDARERAAEREITDSDRVLSTLDWDLPTGVTDSLLAVLAAQAALVQCANSAQADPDEWHRRQDSEKITHVLD